MMSYPTAHATIHARGDSLPQPADNVPWPAWRIVNSPRWTRSASGPDYLTYRGWLIGIVRDTATGGFRYVLNEDRSAERFASELEAKLAAAIVVLNSPRRDRVLPGNESEKGKA